MRRDGQANPAESGMRAEHSLPEGATVGPYVVERLVAVGGYAQVYRGLDTRDSTPVALKLLRPGVASDAASVRRLAQEASAYGCLRHPRIVALREVLDHEGTAVLATEWVDGVTLSERIAAGRLSPSQAGQIMLRVAEALAVVHVAGLAHRDVKPDNIMVSESGEVKLLDFGLAKAVGSEVLSRRSWETAEGVLVGTPAYMAPEQVRGEAAGLGADVFAFGTVLFESLTGTSPFLRASVSATLHAVTEADPGRLPRLPGRVGKALLNLARRCLQRQPEMRPSDALELVTLLREALARTPTIVRRTLAAITIVIALVAAAAILTGPRWSGRGEDVSRGLQVHPAQGVSPVLTRNGEKLIHVSRDGREIWMSQLRTGTSQRVLAGPYRIGRLAVVPSGQSVLFDAPDDAGERWVWEVALIGGTPRKIVRGCSPAVSPDGNAVACLQSLSGEGHDVVVSLRDGSARRVVCRVPGSHAPMSLVFLPDGDELLLSMTDSMQRSELLRVEVATGRVRKSLEVRGIAAPGLAVVGPLDAVLWPLRRAVDESSVLGLTSLKRGGFRVVYPGPGWVTDPTISEDQEKLLFRTAERHREIVEVVVDPASGDVVSSVRPVPATRGGSQPRVSPDGRRLAFQAGSGELWLLDRTSGDSGPFLTTGEAAFNPAWSADGALVAYACLKGLKSQIWLAGADGSDPQPLTAGDHNDFQPVWHPDGRRLFFVSDRAGADQLFRLNVATGEITQFTTGGAANPDVSSDGHFIAFREARSNGRGVVRLFALTDSADVGEEIWAFEAEIGEWAGAKPRFSPDGRWVAFDLPSGPLGADIWAAPTSPGGAERLVRLTEFPFPARTQSWFDWAPDGRLVVALERQEDRLLLFPDARTWIGRASP